MPKLSRTNTAKWDEKKSLWRIVVTRDGKRKEFTSAKTGRTGQREANKKADNWLNGVTPDERLRVEAAYTRYLENEEGRVSTGNMLNLRNIGKVWIIPHIGDKYLDALTLGDLQKILDDAEKAGRSRKTIKNIRGTMSVFFKYCRRNEWTQIRTEDLSVSAHAPIKQKQILQSDSLTTLFKSDQTTFNRKQVRDPYIFAYRFIVVTGLRPGEMMGARWEDVWDNVLHLQRSINSQGDITCGKNDNARRNIPLSPLALQILEDQRVYADASSPYIFNIFDTRILYKHWRKYCEFNDIPKMSVYELRHTYVSIAAPILHEGELKPLVGHSRSMDTLGVYAHEMEGDKARTVEKVDERIRDLIKK